MRPKVLISSLALAFAILLPALYFHFKSDSPTPSPVEQQPVAVDNNAPPSAGLPAIIKRVGPAPTLGGLPTPSDPYAGMSHEEYVQKRTEELTELGMNNDPDSLRTIVSELENHDTEIRHAALSAAVQFGSQDALPALRQELDWVSDPQEKVDIQKAIDFLQLPSLDTDDSNAITRQSTDGSVLSN